MSEYDGISDEPGSGRRRIVGAALGLAIASWILLDPVMSAPAIEPAEPTAPSFSAIYERVLRPMGCAAAFCHGEQSPAGALQLGSREQAYEALVGVAAMGLACADSGLVRVVPGDPAASLLLMKLAVQPPCGVSMPAPDALLRESQITAIRRWIELGALYN